MRTAAAEQDVDHELIALLYAAARERCVLCQDVWLDRLAPDATSTASLGRWAGEALMETSGTIPDEADDEGPLSEMFRLYIGEDTYVRDYEAVLTPCLEMSAAERRAAAGKAIGIITELAQD
jgi:hypothetical protein